MAQTNDRTKTRVYILARVKAEEQGWLAITHDYETHEHHAWSIVGWVLTFECPEKVTPTSDIYMFQANTTSAPFGPSSPNTKWLPEDEFGTFVERPLAYLPPENIRVGEYGRLRTNEERLASYVTAYEEYLTNRLQNKGDRK
jgi:hypothetical protein